jgi:hypothetical protein
MKYEIFLTASNLASNFHKYVRTFSLHYTLRQTQGEARINPHAELVEALSTIITSVLTLIFYVFFSSLSHHHTTTFT